LGEKRLAGFLDRHGYCGGKPAAELLARLRSAPEGRADRAEEEARRTAVLSLVAALRPLVEQIRVLDSRIADAVRAHPDGEVFLSLFRNPGSTLTAAKLLSEIGDRRERYASAEALAADAGMCPVAKESGKRKVATFRRACDKRLRDTLATLANSSRQHNPWAKDIYLRARGRGCDHPHAIRVLGRAWVRVIWRMWQDGAPYDPLKHGGRRRLNAAGG
jgi:transposase